MITVKKAKLGLMSKPVPTPDLRIHEPLGKTSCFKYRAHKVHTVTIEKNEDFKEKPF